MQKFYVKFIPAIDTSGALEELNKFMSSHRKMNVEKHFVSDGVNLGFAFVIAYDDVSPMGMNTTPAALVANVTQNAENVAAANAANNGKNKGNDYYTCFRDGGVGQSLFRCMRDSRNLIAQEDGIKDNRKFNTVFSNEEMALMCLVPNVTAQSIVEMGFIAQPRCEKYLARVFNQYNKFLEQNAVQNTGVERGDFEKMRSVLGAKYSGLFARLAPMYHENAEAGVEAGAVAEGGAEQNIPQGVQQGVSPQGNVPQGVQQGVSPQGNVPQGVQQGVFPQGNVPQGNIQYSAVPQGIEMNFPQENKDDNDGPPF